ncbi:MAG: Ycf66 family protein [Nostoc sp. ChiSLP02]|nr:Ycf66 family protein [Nostoc sp. DedSLP05]MDZ8098441.1 Ycf66 family protein [Nostoc sp. DedSLP01]MDZ8189815.1 Ycf66 family protein [Nostoc sp. ChiSLP02]
MINFGLNSASVLAQVNFGANSASILGIFLAVAGAALYFLRTVRPELSRDQDIFFAAVGLLCGFILIFQGWRLDPILQFGQLLLVGTTVFFAVESIRLRSIATQQAKRNTPIVDDEREVSGNYEYRRNRKDYRAEIADLEPLPYDDEEERRVRRRIPGSRDENSTRDDYYEDQPPRRSERRNSSTNERQSSSDRTRRRSSGRPVNRPSESFEDENWGSSSREVDDWDSSGGEVRKPSRRGNNGSGRPENREDDVAPRPRRRRPASDSAPRRPREDDDAIPTEYVPYNPIEKPSEGPDNSTDFDDDV